MRHIILLLAMAMTWPSPSLASINPRPGAEDPRIQSVGYDPLQVVSLKIAPGYTLVLAFGSDERIENVALGNSSTWQVTPNASADHLFVKSLPGALMTNMTVITGERTYSFELFPQAEPDATTPFLVRFVYPPGPGAIEHFPPAPPAVYRLSGAKALRPSDISDDGQFTSLAWPDAAAIPAVYAIGADGQEFLVNGVFQNGHYVISKVADAWVFRLGKQEARATRQPIKPKR